MKPYHKINAPFKRDMDKRNHPLIVDDWAVEEFKILRNIRWSAREKIDGTNIRVNYFDGELTFSGRTDAAIIPNNLLEKLIDMFPIKNFSGFKDGITLYGEGYGHKIQSGGKYLRHKKTSFALFDVRVGEWWLKEKDIEDIATSLGIECAPPLGFLTLDQWVDKVAAGLKSRYGDFYAEGVVIKPEVGLFGRNGHRIITKIKHKDFWIGREND